MNFKQYLSTYEGISAENKWNRIVIVGLVITITVMALILGNRKPVVTLQPFTLSEEAWIATGDASQSYKEAWGMALALMTGNVTPGSVDFISERVAPVLDPSVYIEVMDALQLQARNIREDRVTMRFEPRYVEYESQTDKVFVYGYSFVRGSNSPEQRAERTYEYVINIANYAPRVSYINTYEGPPRTQSVLERMQRREESRAERERNR